MRPAEDAMTRTTAAWLVIATKEARNFRELMTSHPTQDNWELARTHTLNHARHYAQILRHGLASAVPGERNAMRKAIKETINFVR